MDMLSTPIQNMDLHHHQQDQQEQQLQCSWVHQQHTASVAAAPMDKLVEGRVSGSETEPLGRVVSAEVAGDVQDHGDGSYTCSYTHTKAGQYDLYVMNGEG